MFALRLPKCLFALVLFAVLSAGIARADIYTTVTDLSSSGGTYDYRDSVINNSPPNSSGGYIYRTTGSGNTTVTTVFSQGFFEDPQGIAINSVGTIYVLDNSLGGLYSMNHAGEMPSLVASFDTVFESGLAVDNNDVVYAFDYNAGASRILRFQSNGSQLTPWTNVPFSSTSAMAFSPLNGGRLYVANYDNVEIGYYDMTGAYNPSYKDLSTQWPDNYWPTGLAVDALGNVYVGGGDDAQGQILMIAADDQEVTTYVDGLAGVMGLAWTGSALAIADQACGCGAPNSLQLSDGSGGSTELYDFGDNNFPSFVAYTPVPEPSTVVLLGGGIAGMLLMLRRRFIKA